jgi:hypothetical protein
LIIDAHRHVIAAEMTSAAAPKEIRSTVDEVAIVAEPPGKLCPNKHSVTKAWHQQGGASCLP